MEIIIIILSILAGALVGALITALILQNKHGKVAAQVSVLEATLKSEAAKTATLMQEKEKAYQTVRSKVLLTKKSGYTKKPFAPSNTSSMKQWKKCLPK